MGVHLHVSEGGKHTLFMHCNKNPIYVFLEKELRGHIFSCSKTGYTLKVQDRDLNPFIFFRKKLRSFDGFDQMSRLWSMFRFRFFRIFCEKIAIFRTFDHWSEILSMSAGRPLGQGVCPPLHECGNWDWGRAIPFLGTFVSNFVFGVFASQKQRL